MTWKDARSSAWLRRSLLIVAMVAGMMVASAVPARAQVFDPTFAATTSDDVWAIAVQGDGKVLVGGTFTQVNAVTHSRLARLNADGSLDATFTASVTTGSAVYSIAVLPNGQILVAGAFTQFSSVARSNVVLLNANGTIDSSFATTANNLIRKVLVQPDGKILLGGLFGTVNGTARSGMARLNADGTLDGTFAPSFNNQVNDLALQPDGKIIVGGYFSTVNGIVSQYVARLNAGGTLDTGFTPPVATFNGGRAEAVAVRSDGRILVGGYFTFQSPSAETRSLFAQLNTDGSLDTTFNVPIYRDPNLNTGTVYEITIQPDGRILIAGYVGFVNAFNTFCVTRLLADGAFDPTFGTLGGASFNNYGLSVVIQPDNKVLIGGGFGLSNVGRLEYTRPLDFSITPNTGQLGDPNVPLSVVGQDTHFVNGVTTLNLGPGITVNSLTVQSPIAATANVSISSGAALGARPGTVTTGGEVVTRPNAFTVTTIPTISVAPNNGPQGQANLNIVVSGQFTHFVNGTTTASFGTGITVNSTTVQSATQAMVSVTIAAAAATGLRSVTVTTGAEVVVGANLFTVTAGLPTIPQVSPASGLQGQASLLVSITGAFTHFVNGTTTASFGAGITVNSTTVFNATFAQSSVTIAPGAATGLRTVTLTTGGEVAAGTNLFTVNPGTPVLTQIFPTSGQQGATLDVLLTGQFTHFAQGTTTSSFGAGITVNGTTVQTATTATANITIAPAATLGLRTVSATTGGEVVQLASAFNVTVAVPTLKSVTPSASQRGKAGLVVTLTGQSTHFAQGQTTISFGAGVTVNFTAVQSPTQAMANITVAPGAVLGPRLVTLSTGAEVVSLSGFVVTAVTSPAGDFDGDRRSDIAVFRPSIGAWFVRGISTTLWGGGADVPVPGDYDGDGKADVAIFRPSTGLWFILLSSTSTGSVTLWGGGADIPVQGDYDGDGKTDIAVFRPSTGVWFILQSSTATGNVVTWGGGADIPVARDYDGDGKTDVAIFRPSTGVWFILQSSTATGVVTLWGGGADIPVAADFDGDGRADIAVFRPSTSVWFTLFSSTSVGSVTLWGGGGDIPVPGDFDADGKTDIAVFRPSTGDWYIINSSTSSGAVVTWGGGADIPVLRRP